MAHIGRLGPLQMSCTEHEDMLRQLLRSSMGLSARAHTRVNVGVAHVGAIIMKGMYRKYRLQSFKDRVKGPLWSSIEQH